MKTILTNASKLVCVLLYWFLITSPAHAALQMSLESLAYSDPIGQASPVLLGFALFFAPIYGPLLALGAVM